MTSRIQYPALTLLTRSKCSVCLQGRHDSVSENILETSPFYCAMRYVSVLRSYVVGRLTECGKQCSLCNPLLWMWILGRPSDQPLSPPRAPVHPSSRMPHPSIRGLLERESYLHPGTGTSTSFEASIGHVTSCRLGISAAPAGPPPLRARQPRTGPP